MPRRRPSHNIKPVDPKDFEEKPTGQWTEERKSRVSKESIERWKKRCQRTLLDCE